jgi:hypothetical protein
MVNIPPHIQQAYPNLPPHIQSQLASQHAMAGAHAAGQQPAKYGAIAYIPTSRRFVWSWSQDNVEEAKRAAMAAADTDAIFLTWANNSVIAAAIGPNGGYGFAYGSTIKHATEQAVQNCLQHDSGATLAVAFDTRVGENFASTAHDLIRRAAASRRVMMGCMIYFIGGLFIIFMLVILGFAGVFR